MADSKIEWTDKTWNPTLGCTRVSAGCDHCYAIRQARMRESNPNEAIAEAFAGLTRNTLPGGLDWTGRVNMLPGRLDDPLRWRKPARVFVDSMSDLFHDEVTDEFIARVFAVMVAAPMHTFQVLTKRHGRMRSLLGGEGFWALVSGELGRLWNAPAPAPLRRVPQWIWGGVSIEDQATANLRVPALLETPWLVRFVSAEPLLAAVDLTSIERRPGGPLIDALAGDVKTRDGEIYAAAPGCVDWVIAGGESGPDARPMHPAWPRSLRDQVVKAGRAFLFKQWGDYLPVEVFDDGRFAGGRAYRHPKGGTSATMIRERGPSRTFRSGTTRPMRPGDRTAGGVVMLDADTVAVRVGKGEAGRELDGRTWDEYPETVGS